MQSIDELIRKKEELEKQIQAATSAKRTEAIAKVKELMQLNSLTVEDLGGSSGGKAPKDQAGKKVAAKYRNQATGETWTGRGIKPKWLQEALRSGKNVNDFLIQDSEGA